MATARGTRLDKAYRRRMQSLRDEVARRVEREFDVDPDDIEASVNAFIDRAAPVIASGQATAQTLTVAYLAALVEAETDEPFEPIEPDPAIVGRNIKGDPLPAALAAIGPVILARIGEGVAVQDAIATGASLATRTADNEVTAAGDAEADRQARAATQIVGWEGIVSPGSCDPCAENAGIHDLSDEFYRHPGCGCEKTLVVAR